MPKTENHNLSLSQALDLGCQFALAGQHDNAITLFKGVLIHEPENFEAIERLGASLFALTRTHEALYWFWRGRKLNRKSAMALTNYGLCVAQLGHWEEALPDLERAIYQVERDPAASNEARALCYNNLGNTLEKLKRYPAALAALDRGIALCPADTFPHYNRGIVLLRLNRQREAIAEFDYVLSRKPDDADAHYNRGMARLLLGDLPGGFADYEYRLTTTENAVPNLGLPADKKWNGTDSLDGKTVLIHGEQGLGDDIQFFRFIPMLERRFPRAKLKLICHTATAPLAAHLPVELLKTGGPLPDYDRWVALMSLPHLLSCGIPGPHFIPVLTERAEEWKAQLDLPPGRLNVGVCWAGNFQHKNDAHRSIPLTTFAALFDVPGVNFVSLQQMRPEDAETFAQLKAAHPNLTAFYFDDFRDTAAAILNLDLVISVDTAVAHLAATLGVDTTILIPKHGTDWRWQLDRVDSPWYPTMAIERQVTVGDWTSVIRRLARSLELETERRSAAA